jgi:hypothetical protein
MTRWLTLSDQVHVRVPDKQVTGPDEDPGLVSWVRRRMWRRKHGVADCCHYG